MASMNRVLLAGNLTRDPTVKAIPSGTEVADMRLAVNERYKDRALPEQIAPLRERYRQALERELAGAGGPKAAGLWRELGLLSSALGDTAAAVRATEKALEFDPTNSDTYGQLGMIYVQSKNYESALPALQCAVEGCTAEENTIALDLVEQELLDASVAIEPVWPTSRHFSCLDSRSHR